MKHCIDCDRWYMYSDGGHWRTHKAGESERESW